MNKVLLNEKGIIISALSLGTWAFSGAEVWGPCDEKEAAATIHCALERDINLFDSAENYGNGQAEEILGRALKGRRSQAVIATKVHRDHLRSKDLISACENSLKRIGTDYIDIYQVHWSNPDISPEETYIALEKLKESGKILSVGVCNHGKGALSEKEEWKIVTDQMPYSLLWRISEEHFTKDLLRRRIMVWAYSPLAQGLLSGKYLRLEDVPMNRRTTRFYDSKWGKGRHTDGGYEQEIFSFLQKLDGICKECGYAMPDIAIQFLKRQQDVGSILVGSRSVKQLEENIKSFETYVPDDVLERVTALSGELKIKMGSNADMWESRSRIY